MTKEERAGTLEFIHEHSEEYATETWGKDKSGRGWICPICGSGTGDKGTGITTKDGRHFTCWAGCFQNADLVDIIGMIQHIPETDHAAKFEAARREFGLDVDEPARPVARRATAAEDFKVLDKEDKPIASGVATLDAFFLEANRHLSETDYHRGISLDTLNRFKVGYCEKWRHPKPVSEGKNPPYSPRLIIPTGLASYVARDTRAVIPPEQEQFKKQQVGSRGKKLFNEAALTAAKGPVFITEGEFDAMSIIDVGGEAVTAGSAAQWRNVFEAVKAHPQQYSVIVAFDNDEVGERSGRELKIALGEAGISFVDYKPPMGCKDANEALMKDRAVFTDSVQAAIAHAMKPEADRQEEERVKYLDKSAAAYLPAFIEGIMNNINAVCYSTGFDKLDDILNGGLSPALYIMGAVSSLGKTTFVLQIADNVAASGRDVLFFSLEMSQDELIAKSLSRLTYQIVREKRLSLTRAKTTAGILSGHSLMGNRDGETETLEAALTAYREYAGHIFIKEGGDVLGVNEIRAAVDEHIKVTGQKPLVAVDYLQILTPDDPRATDKQNADRAVTGLKHISRDFGVPVLAISSFNRENYSNVVSMSSFKESGGIEFSSDVLIGLQYDFMNYREGETDKQRLARIREARYKQRELAKNGEPQRIEAQILKHRNGRLGEVLLDFVAKFNCYATAQDDEEQFQSLFDVDELMETEAAKKNARV